MIRVGFEVSLAGSPAQPSKEVGRKRNDAIHPCNRFSYDRFPQNLKGRTVDESAPICTRVRVNEKEIVFLRLPVEANAHSEGRGIYPQKGE
jgi:hypothetical protein